MKALTVWQPWASLLVGAPPTYDEFATPAQKPIENRGWCPPRALVGQRLAIHAAKKIDDDILESFYDIFKAKLYGDVRPPYRTPALFPRGAIVGMVTLERVIVTRKGFVVDAFNDDHWKTIDLGDAKRWYTGEVGWVFRDAVYLREPIACVGKQGLWDVPREVFERMACARCCERTEPLTGAPAP